jgi:predicted GNAT family acetyltransferase
MDLTRHETAEALLAAAGAFLVAREAEHNLPLGILTTLRDQPGIYEAPPYLATVSDAGHIALVAVRTPPYGVVLSEPGTSEALVPEAVQVLVADLVRDASDLPTVIGPRTIVEPFVRRWSAATGRPARLEMAERAYRLSRVVAPRTAPGSWRLADERDRTLLREWIVAFTEEALPPGSVRVESDAMIDRWVRHDDRFAYLWEVEGRIVSLVVAGSRTPNGRRIGPVYTPPSERGRGFASALTAAASQDQLERGRRFCFLFTDLANPTSNAIYQRIGYEPVADIVQYRFDPAPPLDASSA